MAMPHTITPLDREQYHKEALVRAERHRIFAKMAENEGNEEEKALWLRLVAEDEKSAAYWSNP